MPAREPVSVVGLHGGQWFGREAEQVLRDADVLIGARRQFDLLDPAIGGDRVELWGVLDEVLGLAEARRDGGARVCILAAGDPGFFGLVRLAAARFDDDGLRVHPAPSSVSLAFARVGMHWDDAVVVSAHGRPLEHAVEAVQGLPKVAVLTAPDTPPEALGQALEEAGCTDREAWVCSRLGEPDEDVHRTDVGGLAIGTFDPLSVVVVCVPTETADGPGLTWGRSEDQFAHRDGMITKAEVRAIALGKLALPRAGVLWDVGAGSGSVGVEAARLAPGLRVYAVERDPEAVEGLRANTRGTGVSVVEGEAPEILARLPDPDRAFVGGGGAPVLDEVVDRLAPGGLVVATYATLDGAAHAADRLGSIVQVQVSRGEPAAGSVRLAAANPVFVCWGPEA